MLPMPLKYLRNSDQVLILSLEEISQSDDFRCQRDESQDQQDQLSLPGCARLVLCRTCIQRDLLFETADGGVQLMWSLECCEVLCLRLKRSDFWSNLISGHIFIISQIVFHYFWTALNLGVADIRSNSIFFFFKILLKYSLHYSNKTYFGIVQTCLEVKTKNYDNFVLEYIFLLLKKETCCFPLLQKYWQRLMDRLRSCLKNPEFKICFIPFNFW